MRPALLLALAVSLAGCNLSDLTPASEVVRTRVAGIKASPAEIGIGESTTLEPLLVQPPGDRPELGALWFSCLEGGGAAGCLGLDFASLGDDDDSASAPDASEFQFGVGDTFTYTAEGRNVEDAWAALEPQDRVEGLSVLVSVNFVERSNLELQGTLLRLAVAAQEGDSATLEALGEELQTLLSDGISAARRVVISDKNADQPDPVACADDPDAFGGLVAAHIRPFR